MSFDVPHDAVVESAAAAERRADRWRAITVNANRILEGGAALEFEVATAVAVVRHCSAILTTVPAGDGLVASVLEETLTELEARLRMAS